jgi:hypothetical protein
VVAVSLDNLSDKEVDPFPVLSCKEHHRFIEIQRIIIQTFISEFWLERAVHYSTFNPPFRLIYNAALVDILELDLLIYEIIFARERRELYISYVRNFPRGTFTCVCKHWWDIPEGPSNDKDNNNNDNNNPGDNGNGCKDSKSPDVVKKVGDKAPPDTDTTLPLSTTKLARQAGDLHAHLSVFPKGHWGPSGDRLLA